MINTTDPREFELLMVRIQARRVAQAHQSAGKIVPPDAAAILADDTEEAVERDSEAFTAWCAARGVEVVRVRGISDFRAA